MTSLREAEAMIGEVAQLEYALREAAERQCSGFSRDTGSQPSQLRFDTAVASYGAQLRTWIDLQVDSRLNQVLPGLLEGELLTARQDGLLAFEAVERLDVEIRALTSAQAKLLSFAERFSSELECNKAAISACQVGTQQRSMTKQCHGHDETLVALQKVRHQLDELSRGPLGRVDELARTVALAEEASCNSLRQSEKLARGLAIATEMNNARLTGHEEALSGLAQSFERQRSTAQVSVQQAVDKEIEALERRLGCQSSELMSEEIGNWRKDTDQRHAGLEKELVAIMAMKSELEARLEQKLEAQHLATADASERLRADLQSQLCRIRGEFDKRMEAHVDLQRLDSKLEHCLDGVCAELEARVEVLLGSRLETLRSEHRGELSTLQQRLTDDLHGKIGKALSEENAAIAALDEQLWITDQRLGQRIDELAQEKIQDCPSFAKQLTRKSLGGGGANSSPASATRHSTEPAADILVMLPEVDEHQQVSNLQEQGVEGAMNGVQTPHAAIAATVAVDAATPATAATAIAITATAAAAADAATIAPANTAPVHPMAVHQAASPHFLEHELTLRKEEGSLGRCGRAFSVFSLAGQALAEAAELSDTQSDPLSCTPTGGSEAPKSDKFEEPVAHKSLMGAAFTFAPTRHSFPIDREPRELTRLPTASSDGYSLLRDLRHNIGGGSAAAALVARAERRELRELQARQRQKLCGELLATDLPASETLAVSTHAEK